MIYNTHIGIKRDPLTLKGVICNIEKWSLVGFEDMP